MSLERIQLAAGVPTLESLGVADSEELFRPGGAPDRRGSTPEGRYEARFAARDGRATLRYPLPGTPDANGRLSGRPSEVGSGWVVLARWSRPPLRELLRSRFTQPRSTSLAEREWNLYCRLLDHGVGVPRPLAVGARGRGLFSRESFLVTRELQGFEPFELWARTDTDPGRRRRAANALGLLLSNVIRAGVLLPRLSVDDLVMKPEPTGEFGASCDDDGPTLPGRMGLRRLPGLALVGLRGGGLRKTLRAEEVRAMLEHLHGDACARDLVSAREARRIVALAVRGAGDRRALWSRLGLG